MMEIVYYVPSDVEMLSRSQMIGCLSIYCRLSHTRVSLLLLLLLLLSASP